MQFNHRSQRPMRILLAEDCRTDALITKIGLQASRLNVEIFDVADGRECMAFLRKQAPYADVPTPDLILLDLNMPVMNGREVLAEVVNNKDLKHLPVVILTSSKAREDIDEMYRLRCNSYLLKNQDAQQFSDAIRKLAQYLISSALPDSA